ncbi:hypothetical protein PLESTB_001102600 [Pleodorina starrii]|uniref:Uncharacterized protein n=1 Tax=Pleodorina starrii TaxID=330485 RepID=A0A9W6BQJ5_9CHLO|nr:hypothetical protein PLESTM_001337400 [Pleodorina starrii]GLC56417.1 hypothetical protein PLESTB_001102600 [Pleodorina starrii]GLC68917.1 hypothetical protein PLESTF_000758800 [Pleodorina starrii]
MADLKNFGSEYDVTKKTLKSSCKFKVADSVGVKAKLTTPGNLVNLEMDGKNWGLTYDVKKKDLELKGEWKVKNGEFKIKQKIPGLKTELLPSPEVQWKSHVVKNKKFAWEVEPSYCFQARKAKLDQTVELNGGKQKLKLESDSKAGVAATVGTLTVKVGNSWAKQLSLKYSQSAGPSLIHEVEPSKKVSLKSTVGLKAQDLKVVAEVKPGKVAGLKPKITLEGKVTSKAPLKPSGVIAGLSFDV